MDDDTIERRANLAAASLMQNEALLEGLETEAASTLLSWGSECAKKIVYEIGDPEDSIPEEAASSRLRAVREMMRQIRVLLTNYTALDQAACSALFDTIITQIAAAYGPAFVAPDPTWRAMFINVPISDPRRWVESLRFWIESQA
jgi:hypothetical protein